MATDRTLIDATNATFWQITQYKPGRRLDMSDPKDRAMSKTWLDIYHQVAPHRDRAAALAKQVFAETTRPYVLIIERRDGTLTHQEFSYLANLDVQYSWVLVQPEYYTYIAEFDLTQDPNGPLH